MPELTPQSTTPPDPTSSPSDPAPDPVPPRPEDETPTGPPIIDPAHFEDFPVFRECFLVYIAGATANATLRAFGNLFYDLILEYWKNWPDQPEGTLRGGLRAAIADLRHVQGFIAEWTGPDASFESAHEEHLAKVGGGIALEVGKLVDRLETEMGPWRGEV
jgi:hypothetical protein